MRSARILLLMVLVLCATSLAAQVAYDQAAIDRRAAVELGFRHPKAPIVPLRFEPVGDMQTNGLKQRRYGFRVEGLNRLGTYRLMNWDIGADQPQFALDAVLIKDDGLLLCGDESHPCPGAATGSAVVIAASGMIGQPRRYLLTTPDGRPVAMGEVVPYPAEGSDRGCSVEAVLLTPNAEAVLVIGTGFKRRESVKIVSSSKGEMVNSTIMADANGELHSIIRPYVRGANSGQTLVTLKTAHCRPQTSFRWGPYEEERVDGK